MLNLTDIDFQTFVQTSRRGTTRNNIQKA